MSGRERPMHLLVFGLRWPPETFIRAKLGALASRGVRVTVACPDVRPRPSDAIAGVRVEHVVPTGRTSVASLVAALLRLSATRPGRLRAVARAAFTPTGEGRGLSRREGLGRLRTYARLTSLRPDLVHFEWPTAAVHFHALVDALACPSTVSVRGGDVEIYAPAPARSALVTGIANAFRRAAAVHCISEATLDAALALGLAPAKGRVIRPAVNASLFEPAPPRPEDGTFRVVAVGWLHWRKGWESALETVATLVRSGVPVVLDVVSPEPAADMAASSDRLRLDETIDDLGLQDRVRLHGALDHAEVRALLRSADALLHTSLAEGIPNVVLEAMASAIPIVATDVGGTSEVLTDGVEGFLVQPRDRRAAARALEALWRDADLRRRMGGAGRARAERQLTLDQQTERWLELYEEVLRRPASERPLHLVEVGLDWPPEAYIRRRLQRLAERGAHVSVASILSPGETPTPIDGVHLVRLPHWAEGRARLVAGLVGDALRLLLRDPRRLRPLLRRWRSTRLLLRLARLRADVAHFEWTSFADTCTPVFPAWGIPVVVSCHGSEVMVDRSTDLRGLFERVGRVHAVSAAIERAAVERGADGSRIRVVPSGVDPNVFRPPSRDRPRDGRFVVVTVGALRWVKGYEHALAAIRMLAGRGIPVEHEIVGGEPRNESGELDRIIAVAADLDLSGRVRLRGRLTEREVVAALQQADAFLQASLSEGMPNAVLEAMACGLPVVATDVGGTREALTDGVEGFLVPSRNPRAMADALDRLWRNPGLRLEMGRAGRSRVEAGLTLEDQLDRFEALYAEVVAP